MLEKTKWEIIPGIENDPRVPNNYQNDLMLECVHTNSSEEILTEFKSIIFGSNSDIINNISLLEIQDLKKMIELDATATIDGKYVSKFVQWFENVYCVFRSRQVDESAKHYLLMFKSKIILVGSFSGENILNCTVYAGKDNAYTDIVVQQLDHIIKVLHKNIL